MKNKDICDYNPICIMSSGLMVDDIIRDHIKRIQSSHNYTEEHDCFFTQFDTALQYFYWKKGTYECIDMPYEHYSSYTTKRSEERRV